MESKHKVKKRRIKKTKLAYFIFIVYSLVFLLFCICFYGFRLVKYYKIYNPKSDTGEKLDLLSTYITQNNSIVYENDGLYLDGGTYIFKGEKVDNYVLYSNLLWRIVKINNDGTMDIILDEPINDLKWNSKITDYTKSDIHKYLNNKFLSILNKDLLVKTSICTDTVNDIKSFSCNKIDKDSYVKLISIADFLNSEVDKTYINDEDSLWTSNFSNKDVWFISKQNISSDVPTESYRIKPVVTIKNNVPYLDGKGTKEDPYQIEKEKKELEVGSYVKLGSDTWIIYEKNSKDMKLILANLYNDGNTLYAFDSYTNKFNPANEQSLAKYLNTTYYNTLSYKDILLDAKWNIGGYNESYKDVEKETVTAKVGTYDVADLKFNHDLKNYFILTPKEDGITYIYGAKLGYYKISRIASIRPAISIKTYSIKSGDGTVKAPYELEVK